jgi:hypothetical protein
MMDVFRVWKQKWFFASVGVVCVAGLLISCQLEVIDNWQSVDCLEIEKRMDFSDRVETLNLLAAASMGRCDELMAAYGAKAQSQFRHKSFSVTRETANLFVPDGTFIEYVLESYERAYLGVLLAVSYVRLHKPVEAKVELRALDHELFAPIYNYGEDPVNLLLSAVLWEKLGEIREARVDWLRLRDLSPASEKDDTVLREFAGERVGQIDRGERTDIDWRVYQLGRFPELDWDLQFTRSTSGYFTITPKKPFLSTCASRTGIRLSTESWFNKIAMRHSHAYHPLLNMQTWIRLPVGITYSLIPVSAGAGIMVGGCVLDGAAKGNGKLCEISIIGGMAMMSTAPQVLEGSLRPDLRHWENVPAAVVVTQASDLNKEPCVERGARDIRRIL